MPCDVRFKLKAYDLQTYARKGYLKINIDGRRKK